MAGPDQHSEPTNFKSETVADALPLLHKAQSNDMHKLHKQQQSCELCSCRDPDPDPDPDPDLDPNPAPECWGAQLFLDMHAVEQESAHELRVSRLILLFTAQASRHLQLVTLGQTMKSGLAVHLETKPSSHEKAAKRQSNSRWRSHACTCRGVQHAAVCVKGCALVK